jgi:hypothetical protein
MSLPYSESTSGERALGEMQKILRSFGCAKFGSMTDDVEGTLLVQFEYRGTPVSVKASAKGYAAAWLKENPWNSRRKGTPKEWERKAIAIGNVAIYSILRDWVKGQVTAIETGVLSFEAAFLGQILLKNGRTVEEHVKSVAPDLLPNLLENRP